MADFLFFLLLAPLILVAVVVQWIAGSMDFL